jgi:hypothetical protein
MDYKKKYTRRQEGIPCAEIRVLKGRTGEGYFGGMGCPITFGVQQVRLSGINVLVALI